MPQPPGFQWPLGRQVGLPRRTWTPSGRQLGAHWAPKSSWTAKLSSMLDLCCQVGLPRRTWTPFWPPTWRLSALPECPDPSEPRSRADENAKSANHRLCSPSALGLRFGSSWGPLGRLLRSTWSLLGASWAQLGVSGAPLGVILGPPGRLWSSTWASWAPPGPTWGPLGAKWAPNGRQLDGK